MKTGLLPVLTFGTMAVALRVLAPPPLADLGAMAYLIAATVAVGSRCVSALAHQHPPLGDR